jgi:hypothetical protein
VVAGTPTPAIMVIPFSKPALAGWYEPTAAGRRGIRLQHVS